MIEQFKDKIITAGEAARLVKSGDRVYVGTASSFAYELMDALWELPGMESTENCHLV